MEELAKAKDVTGWDLSKKRIHNANIPKSHRGERHIPRTTISMYYLQKTYNVIDNIHIAIEQQLKRAKQLGNMINITQTTNATSEAKASILQGENESA